MRILRLDLQTGDELDLHPYVTVLGGLGPTHLRWAAEQLSRLARGEVEGISGLVEAHGMLVEIDAARIAALGLPTDVDVIVRAEQLPGARLLGHTGADGANRAIADKIAAGEQEVTRLTQQLASLSEQIRRATAELDDARHGVDEFAITAHEAAVRAVEESEALARRRAEAGGSLARADLPSPDQQRRDQLATHLAALRQRHQDLETLLDEERLGLLQLLEQLEAERAVLDQLRGDAEADLETSVGAEPPVPPAEPEGPRLPDPVVMAQVHGAIREVLAGPPEAPMVPSLPAAALADQVAAHRQRHREWERELAERGLDPAVIRQRLEAARRVEANAAEQARPKSVSPEDDREIERLHDIVVENADKRASRRQGKEATRLYEESSAKLDSLLERYGFPTYADYIIGRTTPSVDPEARRRLEDAKQMVIDLERELAEAVDAVDQDPHGRMLRAERDQLWATADELLGGPVDGDLEAALRAHMVQGPVAFDAPDRLRQLLRTLDVDVSQASTTSRLIEVADRWYTDAEQAHADASRASLGVDAPAPEAGPDPAEDPVAAQQAAVDRLFDRSVRLDAELTGREEAFDRQAEEIATIEAELMALDERIAAQGGDRPAARDRDPIAEQIASDPTVRASREQAALTAARLERHHAAVELVDRLHSEVGQARAAERNLIAQRDALHAELDSLRSGVDVSVAAPPAVEWTLTEEGVGPIEWYLLGRVASLRSVSAAGSVPLVLEDAFRGLAPDQISTLCGALARIGETVQVIYLGDEPAMAEWATAQGLDRAAVIRPGQPAI